MAHHYNLSSKPNHFPDSVMIIPSNASTVLPPSHMRGPHQSAFTPPTRPSSTTNNNNSAAPSPPRAVAPQSSTSQAPSYLHRKRPTAERPFVAYHQSFLDLLGEDAKVTEVVRDRDGIAAFHEAGVWLESTQQVFITSNRLEGRMEQSTKGKRVQGLVDMHLVELSSSGTQPKLVTIPPTFDLPAANGACLFEDKILICDQGYGTGQLSQLSLLNPLPPYQTTPILNNFHGRPFNSLNDVIVLPDPRRNGRSTIWFTDPDYGFEQGFKPTPCLPPQVYCYDPWTGNVRVVADGFLKPNGIAFDKQGKKCYITDTGMIHGTGVMSGSKPGHIYVYDVEYPPPEIPADEAGPRLVNRCVFAMADSGAPDGIKVDAKGNVYAGCFDGVHVWNKWGTLIGKILFPLDGVRDGSFDGCANFCFIPGGRMICMAEDKAYMVEGLVGV